MCLEFKSNVAYKLNQETCANWIKEDTYKDSIYKVISNAIADCVLKRNEFAEDKINGDVVTFDNKEYKNYTAENWNAVVLYNLVYYIQKHQDFADKCTIDRFYKEYIFSEKLQRQCGDKYKSEIGRAFNDIKEYEKSLNIIKFLLDKSTLDTIYKNARICENYNMYGCARIAINKYEYYKPFAYAPNNKIESGAAMNISIRDGTVKEVTIYGDKAMYSCDLDDYMDITSQNKIANYPFSRVDDNHTTKILRYNNDLKDRKESKFKTTVTLTPEVEKIGNAIDVCWHLCDGGEYKLDWVVANKSYLAKAYVDPREELEIELDMAKSKGASGRQTGISIGRECFKYLDVSNCWVQIIEDKARSSSNEVWIENRMIVDIKNDNKYKLYMPECCDYLIYYSDSIRSIDLSCAEFGRTQSCFRMIKGNPNLERIDSSGENKLTIGGNKLQDLRYMIDNNDKLKKIHLELDYASGANYESMIEFNKYLESVEIHCNDNWRYLPNIKYMIGVCNDNLKKVSVVVSSSKAEIEAKYNAQAIMMPDVKEDALVVISTHGEGEQSNTEIISRRNKKPS